MPRKLSHAVIAIVILAFCIGGFTLLIEFGDTGSGVDSSFITNKLSDFSGNLSEYRDIDYELVQKMDNTSDFEPNSASQVENRGSSAFGIMNLLSKNILTKFIDSVGKTLGVPYLVISFFISIVSLTVIILFVRAYWGSDRT